MWGIGILDDMTEETAERVSFALKNEDSCNDYIKALENDISWDSRKGVSKLGKGGLNNLILKTQLLYLILYQRDEIKKYMIDFEGYLGVDMGITNIATTSDNVNYSGKQCDTTRTTKQKKKKPVILPVKRWTPTIEPKNLPNENCPGCPGCRKVGRDKYVCG